MNWILNIDTAVQTASVCLAGDGNAISTVTNPSQKDHAAWLHAAIQDLLKENNIALTQLKAIAVSAGPGSYTGLRVAMATAKGLCYVLHVPLITISTLKMMATAAIDEPTEFLCPMIDARRMEVFAAVFDKQLQEIVPPKNFILTEETFHELLNQHTITFFGNGSDKFQPLCQHPNAVFKKIEANAASMASLSYQSFRKGEFADLAYSEPYYGKEFYSPAPKRII